MTDNRALWDLVEADREYDEARRIANSSEEMSKGSRERHAAAINLNSASKRRRNALANIAILERPVVSDVVDGPLSSRLRAGIECAPWVIDAVRKLERPVVVGDELDRMCQAFYENKGNMKWEKLSECWKDNYRSNMTAALQSMVRGKS